jgi:hypothetical protein
MWRAELWARYNLPTGSIQRIFHPSHLALHNSLPARALLGKRQYSTLHYFRTCTGLLLMALLSACHRPIAFFQRTPRAATAPRPTDSVAQAPLAAPPYVPDLPPDTLPTLYADSRPNVSEQAVSQRVREREARIQRLRTVPPTAERTPPVSPAPMQVLPGPGPKKKTVREWLGLPPRKELNWWQRIPWQLKAATVVTSVAVVFAIVGITVLAIVFGLIGAFLLVKGLKKSFKVRRGIFGWRVK